MMNDRPKNISNKRILIVDDELDMRNMMKWMLSLDAHEVVEANNGAEAIMMFAQNHFDLVMTDYKMPFLTGSELAACIRQVAPSKPILMVTGYFNSLGDSTPVNAVLRKPFSVEMLRRAVSNLLSTAEGVAA